MKNMIKKQLSILASFSSYLLNDLRFKTVKLRRAVSRKMERIVNTPQVTSP